MRPAARGWLIAHVAVDRGVPSAVSSVAAGHESSSVRPRRRSRTEFTAGGSRQPWVVPDVGRGRGQMTAHPAAPPQFPLRRYTMLTGITAPRGRSVAGDRLPAESRPHSRLTVESLRPEGTSRAGPASGIVRMCRAERGCEQDSSYLTRDDAAGGLSGAPDRRARPSEGPCRPDPTADQQRKVSDHRPAQLRRSRWAAGR